MESVEDSVPSSVTFDSISTDDTSSVDNHQLSTSESSSTDPVSHDEAIVEEEGSIDTSSTTSDSNQQLKDDFDTSISSSTPISNDESSTSEITNSTSFNQEIDYSQEHEQEQEQPHQDQEQEQQEQLEQQPSVSTDEVHLHSSTEFSENHTTPQSIEEDNRIHPSEFHSNTTQATIITSTSEITFKPPSVLEVDMKAQETLDDQDDKIGENQEDRSRSIIAVDTNSKHHDDSKVNGSSSKRHNSESTTAAQEPSENRLEYLDNMQRIERQFSQLKDRLFRDQLVSLKREYQTIKGGSHEKFVDRIDELEQQRAEKVANSQLWLEYQMRTIQASYEAEVLQYEQEFDSDKQAIRQKMLNNVADKMKKLEEEKNSMSLNDITDGSNATRTLRRRNAGKDIPREKDERSARRKLQPPHINYSLKESEIFEDINYITKHRPGDMHFDRQRWIGLVLPRNST